jgi:hypothetical protein
MLGVLVEASRGLFYSPKGPRSRFSFICKAQIALCPQVHRTVRWRTDMSGAPSRMLPADVDDIDHGANRWRGEEPLTTWCTKHVLCTPDYLLIFSQRTSAFPESGQLTSWLGWASDMSGAHWTVRWGPVRANFVHFWAKLLWFLLARFEKFFST